MLSAIPYIENRREGRRRRRNWVLIAAAALIGVGVAILLLHFLVMPLEFAWYALLRRMNLD